MKLGILSVIKGKIIDPEYLAEYIYSFYFDQNSQFRSAMESRYNFGSWPGSFPQYLSEIGTAQGLLGPGGDVHIKKVSVRLVDDFRKGRLGKVSFETPETI